MHGVEHKAGGNGATFTQACEFDGETLTEAIRASIEERYERLRRVKARTSVADELRAIAVRCARRPLISEMCADEILGYDHLGVPTK